MKIVEKTVRIVIETKGGLRFGYEKTETRTEPDAFKPLTPKDLLLERRSVDYYA